MLKPTPKTATKAEEHILGKRVDAPVKYDPSVLVRVPRSENRLQYGIEDTDLPFIGYDVWNAYEVSFLTNNNLPVSGVAKIVYPSYSQYIVESKSLKLYLNSFNMTQMGPTKDEALRGVLACIRRDLSELLEVRVAVEYFEEAGNAPVFQREWTVLEQLEGVGGIKFTSFKEDPALLQSVEQDAPNILACTTNVLRSNCKITHQPDWGTLFVYMRSYHKLSELSLLQYIVSFRNENHFHEEVVEMIYQRLFTYCKPSDLMVAAVYTRRGGIDICPVRATSFELLDHNLCAYQIHCAKLLRQ